jgi:uncharacterized protein YraI
MEADEAAETQCFLVFRTGPGTQWLSVDLFRQGAAVNRTFCAEVLLTDAARSCSCGGSDPTAH